MKNVLTKYNSIDISTFNRVPNNTSKIVYGNYYHTISMYYLLLRKQKELDSAMPFFHCTTVALISIQKYKEPTMFSMSQCHGDSIYSLVQQLFNKLLRPRKMVLNKFS